MSSYLSPYSCVCACVCCVCVCVSFPAPPDLSCTIITHLQYINRIYSTPISRVIHASSLDLSSLFSFPGCVDHSVIILYASVSVCRYDHLGYIVPLWDLQRNSYLLKLELLVFAKCPVWYWEMIPLMYHAHS